MRSIRRLTAARAAAGTQRGMTLIEIMVVILIMGLIMGTVGYAVFRYLKRGEKKTTQMRVERVLNALQDWMHDPDVHKEGDRDCPADLNVLVPDFVKPKMLKDAWSKPLRIICQGEKVCVYSAGPNKRDENGGGDDIKACSGGGKDDD